MRRLAILFVVCLPALVVFAAAAVAGPRAPHAQAAADDPALVERGRELFLTSCSGCHGAEGGGTGDGPSLIGVGAAAADFQLSTGRMPLTDPDAQAVRKPPAFSARRDRRARRVRRVPRRRDPRSPTSTPPPATSPRAGRSSG